MAESFQLGKIFSVKGWYQFFGFHARYVLIAIFVLAGLYIWNNFVAPKKQIQNNQPQISAKDNATANVTNNYIQGDNKNWEAGVHTGYIRLGDQNGAYVGGEIKRRF